MKSNPLENCSTSLTTRVLPILTIFFLIVTGSGSGYCSIEDAPYDKAVALYRAVAKGNTEPREEWEQKIRSLPYTNLLIFRAFCTLPSITTAEAQSTLLRLQKAEIRYQDATLLEYFCAQPGADTTLTWQFLEKLHSTNFVTNSVLSSLPKVSLPSAPLLFPIIDQVKQLEEPGKWAAKALLEVNEMSYSGLSAGLAVLATLTDSQNWAAERLCQITGIDEPTTLKGIREIHKLSFGDSWSSRSIFLNPDTRPDAAIFWLTKFFILPEKDQEHSFLKLPKEKKTALLEAYADASEKLIWQINNLHDVTDDFGREIGNGSLKKMSFTQLLHLFIQLDKKSQKIYQQRMNSCCRDRL